MGPSLHQPCLPPELMAFLVGPVLQAHSLGLVGHMGQLAKLIALCQPLELWWPLLPLSWPPLGDGARNLHSYRDSGHPVSGTLVRGTGAVNHQAKGPPGPGTRCPGSQFCFTNVQGAQQNWVLSGSTERSLVLCFLRKLPSAPPSGSPKGGASRPASRHRQGGLQGGW